MSDPHDPYQRTRAFNPPPQQYDPNQPPPVVSSPPQYGPPPPGYWPAQPPSKKKRGVLFWLGMVALGFVGLCVLGGIVNAVKGPQATTAGSKTVSTAAPSKTAAGKAPAPAADFTPSAKNFVLTPKITRKHCFGSAGCNVNFRIDVAYSGPALDDGDTWEITYEVVGVDDGPMVDTLELTGSKYEGEELSASTKSSGSKLTVRVTSIDKQ